MIGKIIYPGIPIDATTKKRTEQFFKYVDTHGNEGSDAALSGLVKQGICAGASIKQTNNDEDTPLILAAGLGKVKTVQSLLEAGAAIDDHNSNGDTALTAAAKINRTLVVKTLLAANASIEAKNRYGMTALMCAAQNGHSDMIRLLHSAGANIETRDGWGHTPLITAVMAVKTDALKTLLSLGADVNAQGLKNGNTALIRTATINDSDENRENVRILLNAGANTEIREFGDGDTPLNVAAKYGKTPTIQLLMDAGADIETRNYDGQTPIMANMDREWERTFHRRLIEKGANVYVQDNLGLSIINMPSLHRDKALAQDIKKWQAQYKDFMKTRKAPDSKEQIYQLLAVMPLENPAAPIDYAQHIQWVFMHADWQQQQEKSGIPPKAAVKTLLNILQDDNAIDAATAESIFSAVFQQERSHTVLQQRNGRAR